MLWLKITALLIAGISNIFVALAVLLRGTKKLDNIGFFAVSVSMAGWTIGIALFLLAQDEATALLWAKLYYLSPAAAVLALAFFVYSFPDARRLPLLRIAPFLAGFLALAGSLLFADGFLTQSLIFHSWGKEIILDKIDYLLYSAYLLIFFPLALYRIYYVSRHEKGVHAVQAELFFAGFAIALIFGLIFNLFLPWLGNYQLIWVGPLFTSFFILAVAYSIIRHRMFDIRLIVARSVGYIMAVGTLFALYGLTSFFIVNKVIFSGTTIPTSQALVFTVLAVFLAFTLPYLRKFFDKITNTIFYRDAYDAESFIDQLNRVLALNIELNKLLTTTSEVITSTLKAEYCLFYIKETDFKEQRIIGAPNKTFSKMDLSMIKRSITHMDKSIVLTDYLTSQHAELRRALTKNNIAVFVRIAPENTFEQEEVGYIMLGQKKSGNPYGDRDVKILDIISKELLIAIKNALYLEEIEQFNITLQQKIEDATKKLRQTNDKLLALDQTKDDFISMASHQLRTPLTSIKGYVSMVLEGDAGPTTSMQKKMLNQAFISSQRMVYLISDLLNVSRLKTGKFVIEPVQTNLAKVIQDEVEQLQETAKSRNLTITYNKPQHFPTLMLDETKLRQVIMNFMDNAIYYTPQGGTITINLVDKPLSIEFTVVDDGIGVPKHEQHHLFSKFYRAHNAKRARPDGTGLGLFMAKKVIVAQGGAIIFRSKEGHGSTFGFTFAKEKVSAAPDKQIVVSHDD